MNHAWQHLHQGKAVTSEAERDTNEESPAMASEVSLCSRYMGASFFTRLCCLVVILSEIKVFAIPWYCQAPRTSVPVVKH